MAKKIQRGLGKGLGALLGEDVVAEAARPAAVKKAAPAQPKADVDAVRANVLTAMGYAVFRATKGTARSISATGCLAQQVAQAMGITVIDPSEVEAIRRQKLHVLLMGS